MQAVYRSESVAKNLKTLATRGLLLGAILAVAACGGGGGGSSDAAAASIEPSSPAPPAVQPEPPAALPEPEPEPEPEPGLNPGSGSGFSIGATLLSAAPAGVDFYNPPSPLPGRNGDVLWATEIASASNGRIWKILYRSESLDGTPIAVSGWLAIPNGERPAAGYPIVAFAHGTTGLADHCAPTRRSTPQETIALLEDFLARGFVVAATDYEGLGTPGQHQYLVGPSQSRSVLDSARAAQRIGGGSDELVLFGHSQGGHAVILTNEMASSYAPELKVLGTIGSGSGVFSASKAILSYMKASSYRGYLVMAALGQEAAYGSSESPLSLWLTPYGIDASVALNTICIDQLVSTYGSASGMFVADAPLPRTTLGYDFDSVPGLKKGASPLLMIHGKNDNQLPPQIIIPWVDSTCDAGQEIQLTWFNTGHRVPYEDPRGSAAVIFKWIDDRFAGRSAPSSCGAIPQP